LLALTPLWFVLALGVQQAQGQPAIGGSQDCSMETLAGRYVYAISGWYRIAAGVTAFADAGSFDVSRDNTIRGRSIASDAGRILRRELTGTFQVGTSCTGGVTLRDSSSGTQIRLSFYAARGGQEILFIESDSGTIISGRAVRQRTACDLGSLAPAYGYAIQGTLVTGTFLGHFADSGRLAVGPGGNIAGRSTSSLNGQISQRTLSGTLQLSADCSGSVSLADSLGNSINVAFFVAAANGELFFIQVDTGTIVSGRAKPIVGSCGPATVMSQYSYAISGASRFSGSGFTPYADSGTFLGNGGGSFSGSSVQSNGGGITERSLNGTYDLNEDCTGAARFTDNQATDVSLQVVVVEAGKEILFIQDTPGGTISGGAARSDSPCDPLMLSGTYAYAIGGVGPSPQGLAFFADSGFLQTAGDSSFQGSSLFSIGGTIRVGALAVRSL
jgi:hypothetical protein